MLKEIGRFDWPLGGPMKCLVAQPIRALRGRALTISAVAVAVIGECRKTDVVRLRSQSRVDDRQEGKQF